MAKSIRHYINRIKNGRLKSMLEELKWIYGYGRQNAFAIIIYTVLGLSGSVIGIFSSLVSRDLVDIITGRNTGRLISTFVLIIITQILSIAVGQLSAYLTTKISLKVENSIKAEIYDRILVTDWESLAGYHSGDLVMRWGSDAGAIAGGVLSLVPNLIIYLFKFGSALYMVCKYDASFAVFAIISVPFSYLASRGSLKRMKQSSLESMTSSTQLASFSQESFANIQTVKAFDMLGLYSRTLRSLQDRYRNVRMRLQKVTSVNSIILTMVSLVVTYSTYGWGVYKVWNGSITYGTMTMFLSLSSTLSGTIQSLISLVPNTIGTTNSARRLMNIVNLPQEDYSHYDEVAEFYAGHKNDGVGIEVRNVAYTYANGNEVFEDVSFEAYPHEVVALVGPSGEGKTTMLRLLLSIINAKSGEAKICAGDSNGGLEYMELTASARQLFAYVPQGNTMFSGTIAQNLRNVKEDATDEEIVDALKAACAWEFVEKLPQGINTPIQERGGGFSEGQAQRLSIARAILRRSPILLLDEATSALDVYTERKVLQNIMADKYPRTSIVTTHRPSVLNSCNRVYSIHDKHCRRMDDDEIQALIKGDY